MKVIKLPYIVDDFDQYFIDHWNNYEVCEDGDMLFYKDAELCYTHYAIEPKIQRDLQKIQ